MIKVTVWNEYQKIQAENKNIVEAYPKTIHGEIAGYLNKAEGIKAVTSIITDKDNGLSDEILSNTDVLVYWAHALHGEISNEIAERVKDYVNKGMGVIFLHSAHKSKPFMTLLGSSGNLSWREAGEKEIIWNVNPSHEISAGIPEHFVLEHEEMYGEPFDIPNPDDTIFIGWFKGGNVFRSGVTFKRGLGKIFYFQPGHETHPNLTNETVQKIIINAVRWANPIIKKEKLECYNAQPIEKI